MALKSGIGGMGVFKFQRGKALISFFMFILAVSLFACSNNQTNENKTEPSERDAQSLWEQIKAEGKITVATSGTLYPTSFHDAETDELTGFEIEIVREKANRLGLDVEFFEMAFDGMLTSIQSGQVDIAANDISITDERKEKFSFSIPYTHSFSTAIVRKDDLSGIRTVEDLQGKKQPVKRQPYIWI